MRGLHPAGLFRVAVDAISLDIGKKGVGRVQRGFNQPVPRGFAKSRTKLIRRFPPNRIALTATAARRSPTDGFAFKQDDLHALFRQAKRRARAGQAAANNDNIGVNSSPKAITDRAVNCGRFPMGTVRYDLCRSDKQVARPHKC